MAPVVRTAARPRLASSHRPERVSKLLRSSTTHQPRQRDPCWCRAGQAAAPRPVRGDRRGDRVIVAAVAVMVWWSCDCSLRGWGRGLRAVALGVGGQGQEHLLQAGTVGGRSSVRATPAVQATWPTVSASASTRNTDGPTSPSIPEPLASTAWWVEPGAVRASDERRGVRGWRRGCRRRPAGRSWCRRRPRGRAR